MADDKKKESQHRRYMKHREERIAYAKKYEETHKEQNKETRRKYRETHKEQNREYARKWREAHPNYQKERKAAQQNSK